MGNRALFHSRKSRTQQRRRVFFEHRDDPFMDHVLPAREAVHMRYAGRRF